jgi:hypothetical protein
MIDTNGFLGWMVGSNVYHVHTREVTPAKRLVHGGKGGIAMEMKAIRGFLSQYFSLQFGAFSACTKREKKGQNAGGASYHWRCTLYSCVRMGTK